MYEKTSVIIRMNNLKKNRIVKRISSIQKNLFVL